MKNTTARRRLILAAAVIGVGALFVGLAPTVLAACDHEIDISTLPDGEISPVTHPAISAGDLVCLTGSAAITLTIRDFNQVAQAGNSIAFINAPREQVIVDTGNLQVGVSLSNSRFVRLSGGNDNGVPGNDYGILVRNTLNKGVKIERGGADIEVDHLEVTNVAFLNNSAAGIWAADISGGIDIRGIRIHDNYVHDVGAEGIYIGDSNYYANLVPARDIEVYGNTTERTGWDGIQVGAARSGCAIHHNRVLRDSLADNTSQNSGINLNRGSKCEVYNNFVKDGKGTGLLFNAAAGGRAYNNVIVNAGRTASSSAERGIQLNNNTGESADPIAIYNNTVVSAADKGIAFFLDSGTGHLIQNNLVAASGGRGIHTGGRANVMLETNYVAATIQEAGFHNAGGDDYSLSSGSPALDAGTLNGLTFDFRGGKRPKGKGMDIGAYE